jgi:RHS repeat-associated protein
MTRPNNVTTKYTYDNLSHLLSVLHQLSGSTIDGSTYTVDAAGNRTSNANSLAGVTSNYAYDPIYELTGVTQGSNTTESYTYDPVGNRLSSLGVAPYSYNSSNELTSTSSSSYACDYNGNTTSKTVSGNTTNYTWDFENRLASVVLPGTGGTASFKYDPFGRRIYKSSSSGTSIYAYDGQSLIEETNTSGAVVARYSEGVNIDEPLAMLRSSATRYYEGDGLGSITSLSNGAGALAQTYTFDSFGNQTASSGSLTNSFRFTGREFDSETSLYFYRARYFDPSAGRFISEDPIRFAIGPDFYTYVANDPTGQIDPSGLQQQQPQGGGSGTGPVYNPGPWNDPGHTHTNNCYSYACNNLHPPGPWDKPQPGGNPNFYPLNCIQIKIAARADGLKNGDNGNCPCGYYRVRLYFTPNFQGSGYPDYHWYRQDSNGGWSSKHGWEPVGPQLPNTNAVDKDANGWGYGVFCGTMCVASH